MVNSPADTALEFLRWLRPAGPWVLTAIMPDGGNKTITDTFRPDQETDVRNWIERWNPHYNLYYSVNPTWGPQSKKAGKIDIAAIEFAQADLDPRDDETPEQARDRYAKALDGCEPKVSAIVNSGNGVQALWRLADPIKLGKVTDKKNLDPVVSEIEGKI